MDPLQKEGGGEGRLDSSKLKRQHIITVQIQLVWYLSVYNVHFFLTNFASKIKMYITGIQGTFCFHMR